MCGIVGIFSPKDREKVWPERSLKTMLKRVSHRGPDGEGLFAEAGISLGHARLAVLDRSEAGRQPMSSQGGRYVLTFNGEIYNFVELRGELEGLGHTFRSRSDTEVLLAAWTEWGESSLDRFDGIFAFALYDRATRTIFLVRDHIGVKPLFYQLCGDTLFFASELPGLFSDINPVPSEDPEDLDSYFTFNYLPAPRTGLSGARQLEPGSMLRLDENGARLATYWSLPYRTSVIPWNQESVERFSDILFRSVHRQLVSDVPLGLLLSGGLDSYSVALAAVKSGASPAAFTLGFAEQNFDETAAADEYRAYLKLQGGSSVFSWDRHTIEETLLAMSGELLADPSCFPMHQLSKVARSQVSVVLTGDGGDELLAGYDTYRAGMVTPLIRAIPRQLRVLLRAIARYLPSDNERYGKRMIVERMLDAAEAGHRRDHASFRRILGDDLKRRLYRREFAGSVAGHDPIAGYTRFIGGLPQGRSYLAERLKGDISFHLPSILAQVDRMSMAHGLEVRVPLLSREMTEFCINLDDSCLRPLLGGKRILRAALRGAIPEAALKRPKAGFLPPVDRWFRGDGAMSQIFGDYLLTAAKGLPSLDWGEVEAFWKEHRAGRVEGGYQLLGILQYINWSMKCREL